MTIPSQVYWAVAVVMVLLQSESASAKSFLLTASTPASSTGNVGPKRAGLACFPNGSVTASDFVRVADEFASPLSDEMSLRGFVVERASQVETTDHISIELRTIVASVCAPSWGLGDKLTVKGHAIFGFRWTISRTDGRVIQSDQTIRVDTKILGRRLALPAFAQEAVIPLANELERLLQ